MPKKRVTLRALSPWKTSTIFTGLTHTHTHWYRFESRRGDGRFFPDANSSIFRHSLIRTHTRARAHTHTRACTHTHARSCTHTHTNTHEHTHIHTTQIYLSTECKPAPVRTKAKRGFAVIWNLILLRASMENQPYTVDGVWGTLVRLCSQRSHAYGNKIAHEVSHWSWVALYTGQVVLGCLSSCRNFQSKGRCFSLSKLLPKPYWRRSSLGLSLNKKELLDSDGLSSGDDGSDISLGNDGGPDMSGSEDESNTNYGDGEVLDDDDDDQVVFLGGAHGGRGACGRGGVECT